MSRWDDLNHLVELLDRQFAYLNDLGGTTKLIRLRRVLAFLTQEPATASILGEMRVEAAAVLKAHDEVDRNVRAQLDGIRRQHTIPVDFAQYAAPDQQFSFAFPGTHPRHEATGALIAAVEAATQSPSGNGALADVARLKVHHEHHVRRLAMAKEALPWPAFERLTEAARLHNPPPPRWGTARDHEEWARYQRDQRFSEALGLADYGHYRDVVDQSDVDDLYAELTSDVRLVHEELRLRLGVQRSRLAIVQRYAARCEAFDAARLRGACEQDSGNAERILTLDFARFLFDAGFNPIIESTLGGLRPDILDVAQGPVFYAEAKQYADPHPTSRLRKAYAQVWNTWATVRKAHSAPEAFLIIFRRAGPWLEVPDVIRHNGLRLFTVIADISGQGGSREKSSPIVLTEDELRPRNEGDE